jgi:hypothetical protein
MRIKTLLVALVLATVVLTPGVATATPYAYPAVLGPAAGNCYAAPVTYQGVYSLYVMGGVCGAFTQGVIAEFGNSRMVLQSDGNLVIYAIDSGQAAWGFSPNPGTVKAYFQVDGGVHRSRRPGPERVRGNSPTSP